MSVGEPSAARRRLGFAGAILALSLASLDHLIAATALAAIASELGDLRQGAWIFTWYLLASTCSMLVWGKLGDLYGRRRVLQIAIAWFTCASLATGFSRSMEELALGRTLQGMASSALISLPNAIAADLVPARQRGKYLALFTGTWAATSLLGPLIGGMLVDGPGWRWIFWFNVPTAIVAAALLGALRLPVAEARVLREVDYAGVAWLFGAVGPLVLAASLGGRRWPWLSWPSLALAAAAALSCLGFVRRQGRAAEPLLPLRMFASPVVRAAAAGNFVFGLGNFAVTLFIPLFAVVVLGTSATQAGLLLAPVAVGLFLSSFWVGRRIAATGRYRAYPVAGLLLYAGVLVAFMRLGPSTSPWLVALCSLALGFGSGPMSPVVVISLQNAVPQRDVGAASALASFSRHIGQVLGTAALGALLAARLATHLARLVPASDANGLSTGALAEGAAAIRALADPLRSDVIEAFRRAIADGYRATSGVILLAAAIAARLPQVRLATRLGESSASQVESLTDE